MFANGYRHMDVFLQGTVFFFAVGLKCPKTSLCGIICSLTEPANVDHLGLVNKRTACQYRIEATGPWFSICRRYAAHPIMSTLSTPVGHCGVLCSRSGRRSNSVDCALAPEADQLDFRLWR
ncbi:hypothetical protein T11_17120 [Trichinella zimbabwensis]|uniref:Uncharacterized protein n=1 Tax=Trichinella zimbabwensis TaxID=268475 RepID=A0A0V1HKD4_9BILA|nr:hypothetical protein T11_17120 [Trichinella zimbabwensis]